MSNPRSARTLVSGEIVRHDGCVWTVSSVFNTNIEGFRANLTRESSEGTERCTVAVHDCEVI